MRYRIIRPIVAKALLLVCVVSSTVFSQTIKITSPVFQSVYQRDISGQRELTVSGTFSALMDKIEVRAVPVVQGQGIETPWQDLQVAPKGGVFKGKITLYGGWYTLEVRGIADGKVVGRDVLARVGIGEVFLIAGQSNAQGLKGKPTPPGANDDRVLYIDNYENDVDGKYKDLLTDPVPPTFSKITSDIKTMSPRGQTAWCWGALGDLLVAKLNVPVLFINTAWEGTSVTNWSESASGKKTVSFYGYNYNTGMPYANLRIAARNYGSQYGVRAVLWMQGETDGFFGTTTAVYRASLQKIIDQLSVDTDKRIYWVIARTSRASGDDKIDPKPYPGIIAAQNAVLATPFNPTYPGPETDPLVPDRKDGLHFEGPDQLRILANAWSESLDIKFFAEVPPAAPAAVPTITASCVTQNNAVTLSLPAGYTSYEWRSSKSSTPIGIGSTITVSQAATYSATVRDASGNSILTPVVVLDHDAKPAQPSILQSGEQQACADSSFKFSVNDDGYIYNWFKENTTTPVTSGAIASIAESGNYYVKAQNIFGCVSENSSASKLTIRAKISKPTIEPSGPFSVSASIPEGDQINEVFLWRRPGTETDTTATLVKILKSGVYTTKAKVTYTIGSNNLVCYSDTASREFKTNEQNEVVIYPNPSQGAYIYIESRDNVKDAAIELFDIRGNVIKTTPPQLLNGRMQIDVGLLPTGKYILRVTGQGQSLTKQIVIR
ncbi:MAG: T9SS type A sorting domain-containing protein [Dyadobacter sp.]|uniref:T9SS type A sorting domain-containing protein n=1 Tax=Dyadobacter sp. TaxID=1914288 RepID=UPI001B11B18A|nr:T9SS type A sorting domain-containing protein [Dyadobacter sp.]MBO9615904.1 T9SS type A sorting domain-containing protein [Dyadobacter sp.]